MSQTLKPATAAQKLGILLAAAPEEFQTTPITREALDELRANPPAWLVDLRHNGPFPREVVAQKLGVSISALRRNDLTEPLDADQIGVLLANRPEWLEDEREIHRDVVAEAARVKRQRND